MSFLRLSSLFFVALLFATQVASGAPGGGMDGGGGGGDMVPSQDRGGPGLVQTYKDGVAFLAEGECKRAARKFSAVLKKVPRNSEANYLLGISLQCQDRHKSAIRYFKRAKRDDAQFYPAYGALGITYLTLERPDLAEKELNDLTVFKELCEIGDRICPPALLKSHEKLATAIKMLEGQAVEPEHDEK